MITEITAEQHAKVDEYIARGLKIGLCTDPADQPRAEAAITQLYLKSGKTPPIFVWCKSAYHLKNHVGPENFKKYFDYEFFGGSLETYWITFYKYIEEVLGIAPKAEDAELLNIWDEISKSCFWFWPLEKHCFVSDRPLEIHKDERGQLHNMNGPAIRFRC